MIFTLFISTPLTCIQRRWFVCYHFLCLIWAGCVPWLDLTSDGHCWWLIKTSFWFFAVEIGLSTRNIDAWIRHFLSNAWSWVLNTMLSFDSCSEFLTSLLKLLFSGGLRQTILLSNLSSPTNSCLIFNFDVNRCFLCRINIILRYSSIHCIVHHTSRLCSRHLRSGKRILSSTSRWQMASFLLLILLIVKLLIIWDYITTNNA